MAELGTGYPDVPGVPRESALTITDTLALGVMIAIMCVVLAIFAPLFWLDDKIRQVV